MNKQASKIIAVCGLKRSGKDTIADFLVKQYGYRKLSIADPLKEACQLLFGLSHDMIHGDTKDVPCPSWYNLTPRQIMQFFGTEMMQFKLKELMPECGRLFWIRRLIQMIDTHKINKIVIPDVRFIHEYEELVKHYGASNVYVIKVQRQQLNSQQKDTHISESEWKSIGANLFISNDSTIGDLHAKIDTWIKKQVM